MHDARSRGRIPSGCPHPGPQGSGGATRWKALRVWRRPPLTGWSKKHPGCAGQVEACAKACVSAAVGRCKWNRRDGARRATWSVRGRRVTGKGSSSSRRRGGSASEAALPVSAETSKWVRRTRCIGTSRSKRAQAYSSVLSSLPSARTERGGTSETSTRGRRCLVSPQATPGGS